MFITPCLQHSTPNHLVSLLSSRLAQRSGAGSQGPGVGSAGLGQPRRVQERVQGKFSVLHGSLCSVHWEIKSRRRSFREGGGGFAQSLGTAEWGGRVGVGGQGQRWTARGPQRPERSSWGFPERGAAAEPRRAGQRAPERRSRPRAWLELARPPRRAPARGAALRASRPCPRRPARRLRLPARRGRAPRPSPGGKPWTRGRSLSAPSAQPINPRPSPQLLFLGKR